MRILDTTVKYLTFCILQLINKYKININQGQIYHNKKSKNKILLS